MSTIIDIFKFIFSIRKNPHLYFSGLLVTSGCILLSKGIFEILINFSFRFLSGVNNEITFDSILTDIIGSLLIALGLLLFYVKFIKKENLTIEYKNDSKIIKYIFENITTPNKLDYVIDQALYPYLLESSLEEHEHLCRYLLSSNFHVYDSELKLAIENFHDSWNKVCCHWQAFTPTNVPDKLRPNTWLDIARTEDVREALEEVPKAANEMHSSLKKLMEHIKINYKEINF